MKCVSSTQRFILKGMENLSMSQLSKHVSLNSRIPDGIVAFAWFAAFLLAVGASLPCLPLNGS